MARRNKTDINDPRVVLWREIWAHMCELRTENAILREQLGLSPVTYRFGPRRHHDEPAPTPRG